MARDREAEKYMGGGTGNWSRAPKAKTKAKTAAKKKRGVATTEAVKKMKQKEGTKRSTPPKPRAKSGSSGASRSVEGKVKAKRGYEGGATERKASKPNPKRNKTDQDPTPVRGSDADKRGIWKSFKAIGRKIAGENKQKGQRTRGNIGRK